MTATVFPRATDTFVSPVGRRMNDPAVGAKSTDIVAHLQNSAVAMQNELRSFAASRWAFCDFFSSSTTFMDPFTSAGAVNGGAVGPVNSGVSDELHPGQIIIASGAAANSGFRIAPQASIRATTGFSYRAVFCSFGAPTSRYAYIGVHDATAATEPLNGLYLFWNGSTATFKSATGGVRTSAPTTLTVAGGTWYTVDISWVSATSGRCVIRNDSGTVLLDQTITTNVPGVGVALFPTFSGFYSLAAATNLMCLDYAGFATARPAFAAFPS